LIENNLKNSILKHVSNNSEAYFYFKGRVALFAILKAIEVKEDDEIILPAYTCVVVPNAIKYLSAKPIYVDIDSETYNIDLNKIEEKITSKTRAIIIQNTYGLSSNLEEIISIAKKHKLYTIEDCAHGFGGKYNNIPNGTFCDAAFFSTQWNKPFSTGVGGFALINNINLTDKIETINKELIKPSILDKVYLKLLYLANSFLLNDYTYWYLLKLYRFLSKHNLVLGSSSGDELDNVKMPNSYFKKISNIQIAEGLKNISKLDNLLKVRKKNASIYTKYLKNINKTYVKEVYFNNHSFLKYPILVKDRNLFISFAEKHKIKLGDWFISPIHPVKDNLTLWDFEIDKYPVSKELSLKVLNLPTDTNNIYKVLRFLDKYKDYII